MRYTKFISFFIILQMLIGFGLVPIVALKSLLGPLAVLIYTLTSFSILSVFALLIWYQSADSVRSPTENTSSVNALGFGMIFAFIMAEIVAVVLVAKM